VQSLIEKMIVRCPRNTNVGSKRLRGGARAGAGGSSSGNCTWTGKIDLLQAHLEICDNAIAECPFYIHGCQFKGTEKALDKHNTANASAHALLVAQKFSSLEKSIKSLTSKVNECASEARMRELADERIASFRRRSDVFPSSRVLGWTIHNIREKISQKRTIDSDSFLMSVPGRGTYKMKLKAQFGRARSSGQESSLPGHTLGVYLYHVDDVRYCNTMPIYIVGDFLIKASDGDDNKSCSFGDSAKIKKVGSGIGFTRLCDDIRLPCFSDGNWIQLSIEVSLSAEDNREQTLTSR